WSALERRLRRDKSLALGELSEESLNIFLVIQRLPTDSGFVTQIEPIMTAYEVELDSALMRRNQALSDSRDPLLEAFRARDAEALTELGRDIVAKRTAVRDANEQCVKAIKAAVPPAVATQFMAEVNDRAFPRIYRPSRTGRIMRSAQGLKDLDDDTRTAIAALEQEYLAGIATVNDELRDLTLRHEPERLLAGYARKVSNERHDRPDDALSRAESNKRRFDAQYLKRLKALLPNQTFARIPGAAQASRGGNGNGLADQRWAISKFDKNGDGRLDEDEKETLRRSLGK
ncbi:MAG: EF-hand domain-containing protein, partial [Planctomycetota bacterium]